MTKDRSDKYNNPTRSRKEIIINNLIGGAAWAIGATVGLAIIIGALGFLASYIDFVPIVGDFTAEVIDYIIRRSPNA
jgi:hypothetical protein